MFLDKEIQSEHGLSGCIFNNVSVLDVLTVLL